MSKDKYPSMGRKEFIDYMVSVGLYDTKKSADNALSGVVDGLRLLLETGTQLNLTGVLSMSINDVDERVYKIQPQFGGGEKTVPAHREARIKLSKTFANRALDFFSTTQQNEPHK